MISKFSISFLPAQNQLQDHDDDDDVEHDLVAHARCSRLLIMALLKFEILIEFILARKILSEVFFCLTPKNSKKTVYLLPFHASVTGMH